MAQPRVLLLGGHGKISMLMTPIMLSRDWHVTSIIRNPDHREEVMKLGREYPGKLDVLVDNVEKHKEAKDAKALLEKTNPDYVIWAAGAGGKGGAERTYAVDRDAAKAFIEAVGTTSSIKKFLLISYIASRRTRAPWWTDEDWAAAQKVNNETLPDYHKAKVDADEYFVAWAEKRRKSGDTAFQAINLRPGTLTDDAAVGRVSMGHTRSSGKVTRADVADVAAELLGRDDVRGYIDLLNGEGEVRSEIDRIVGDKVDSFQGEDLDRIYSLAS